MSDLSEVGDGIARAVIGVELEESASGDMKVLLSFWRLATPQASDLSEVVWYRVQVASDEDRILRLTLGDFVSRDTCAKSFPTAELDTEILIPLRKVYESAQRGFELWQLEKGKHQDEARV